MSAFARCRRVNSWLANKRLFWALPGRAGGAVVETTVDHTLMRGSKPHDRWYVAELPRSRNLRRIGDPADSGCEGSPDRDRAPSLARKSHVGWFAGASFGCDHWSCAISLSSTSPAGRWPTRSPHLPLPGDVPDQPGLALLPQ